MSFQVGVSHPVDLIKVRMQNRDILQSGFWNSAKHIVKSEGFLGLYRGVGPVFLATPALLGKDREG